MELADWPNWAMERGLGEGGGDQGPNGHAR